LTVEPPNNPDDGQVPIPMQSFPVAASAVPTSFLKTKADEADREQVSLNTTLTANQRRIPFYRRKATNKAFTSDVALFVSASPSIIKSRDSSRSRSSFLSRFVHRVVPCVSPNPKVFRSDTDDDASEPSRSLALKGMSSVPVPDQEMEHSGSEETQGSMTSDAQLPSTLSTLTIPPINVQPPPHSTDPDIIILPPPNIHLLPEDETDGLTSGAVQPPGSTGEQVIRTSSHDSEDFDGTNYTDDEGEDRHMLDEQDEEERLLRNGGSGIPVGPVRASDLSDICNHILIYATCV
jgi:carboxy-terminal domain RNA polymerase II polypeptide A small phosphatase